MEKDGHARLFFLKFLDPRNQLQDVTEPLLIKGGLTPAAKGHLEAICDLNIYEEVRSELFVQGHPMLILDGILSLSDIALKCGFNDVFYFSKAFMEDTGKAPRDYRREITREL